MRSRPLYDIAALLARVGIGAVFIAHGWQKIQVGVSATADSLDRQGVPAPTAAAIYSTFTELLGGLALLAGLALPVAGTLLFLDMAGAFVFVHVEHGPFLVDQERVQNGFELVLVLGLASLLFAAGGGGRFTMDRRLGLRRAHRPDDEEEVWPPPEDETVPWPPPDDEPPEDVRAARTTRPDIPAKAPRRGRAGAGGSRSAQQSPAPAEPSDRTSDKTLAEAPTAPAKPTKPAKPGGPTKPGGSAERAEAAAKPKGGRFRRKARAARDEAPPSPGPAAAPAEETAAAPAEELPGEPADKAAKQPGEQPGKQPAKEPAKDAERPPGKDSPRLAADIISDTSRDVRVAGRRKPPQP